MSRLGYAALEMFSRAAALSKRCFGRKNDEPPSLVPAKLDEVAAVVVVGGGGGGG
jgi:hypothetical protein